MASPTVAVEQAFSPALKKYLNESKGGVLRKLGELADVKGADTYSFARAKKATAVDGVIDLYANDGDNAGNVDQFPVTLAPISAGQRVPKHTLMKTKLDVKNTWVQQLGNAVEIKEDVNIVKAIASKTSSLSKITITGALSDSVNAKKIIGLCNGSVVKAKLSTEGIKGVGLVMSEAKWNELSTADYVLDQDYAKAFGGDMTGTKFFGADVFITEAVGDKAYVIPSMSFGLAENPDGREGSAEYNAGKGMTYELIASKTIGAVCIDPTVITEITFA